MKHVYMIPSPDHATVADGSNTIHQIVMHLARHLPAHGYEVQSTPAGADFVAGHAGMTLGQHAVDVAHCHGLYPTAHANEWPTPIAHWAANAEVIANFRHARQITVPSEWVGDLLRRDMHVTPQVVPWGVDATQYTPGENGGYVLWNKTRPDGVCTPAPLNRLAALMPDTRFLTTFGDALPNVKVTGRVEYPVMRDFVRNAGVYLATTLETFGIGTLEAMSAGVPIVGFRQGGTADIVEHGITGYLAAPGDYADLVTGVRYCFEHRATLGANARTVAATYTWQNVAQAMAGVYDALFSAPTYKHAVSVVIPCHGYARYLGVAVASVLAQRRPAGGLEIIIVLDNDTEAQGVAETLAANAPRDVPIRTLATQHGNPADARNDGIALATGEFIVCLDADDRLQGDTFFVVLSEALRKDRSLGIAFSSLQTMDGDGVLGKVSDWPNGFDFEAQAAGRNQIPTCCMFRREAWVRAGAYRRRYVPAEDAELWLRMGLVGYGAAHVLRDPAFVYRMHDTSLSAAVRNGKAPAPNWTDDKPQVKTTHRPFAALGNPPQRSWPVHNYDKPLVSVIIPVAPRHVQLLRDAVDSVEAQTYKNWELIIVGDGCAIDTRFFPFARTYTLQKAQGASAARNLGLSHAQGAFCVFLDADDVIMSEFLDKCLLAYQRTGRYVYTDWISINKNRMAEHHTTPEPEPNDVFRKTSVHAVTVLLPTAWAREVEGFDVTMDTWEDVDFFMKLRVKGHCGTRVSEPLLVYRYLTGSRREVGETKKPALMALLRTRYGEYMEGVKVCGCNTPKRATQLGDTRPGGNDELIRVEYQGAAAAHDVRGAITKTYYGRRSAGDVFYIRRADLGEDFLPLTDAAPPSAQPTPAPVPVLVTGASYD